MPDEATDVVDTDVEAPDEPETTESNIPTDPEERAKYWEDHAKSLRKESAKYRTRAKEVESKYSKYEADDAKPFLAAADAYLSGETDVVQAWVVRNAAMALGVGEDVLAALAAGDDETTDDVAEASGLTPEKVQELVEKGIADALEAKESQDQVTRIESAAQDLGYTPGTRDYMNLLFLAHHEHDGDLSKADAALKAEPQKYVDEFMEKKRQAAQGTPRIPSGQQPGTGRKITLDGRDGTTKASDAARERLERMG